MPELLPIPDEETYWNARILRNQHRDAWNGGMGHTRHNRIRYLLDRMLERYEHEHPHVKNIVCPAYPPLPKDFVKYDR